MDLYRIEEQNANKIMTSEQMNIPHESPGKGQTPILQDRRADAIIFEGRVGHTARREISEGEFNCIVTRNGHQARRIKMAKGSRTNRKKNGHTARQ